jgi:large subunit ribosomal protein L15
MKLHQLQSAPGSKKQKVRRGRGDSSGSGNYSGRGMKGQNSRSGGGVRIGFEGGQTPLLRRTPKLKGFKQPNRVEYLPINLSVIEEKYSDGETVSTDTLLEKRIIRTISQPVKILGNGKLTKKVAFFDGLKMSASAQKAAKGVQKSAPKKEEAKTEKSDTSEKKKES